MSENTGKKEHGLEGITTVSGLAQDGPGKFRGFVQVQAQGTDGTYLTGQVSPAEMRQMALHWLEIAEAADQDRIVMTMLTRDVGIDEDTAAGFIMSMRNERDNGDNPAAASD
jgi:hypothetical protein